MQGMAQKKKNGKVLDFIERVGNQLPHPYILFLWLCLILALISLACSMAGVTYAFIKHRQGNCADRI